MTNTPPKMTMVHVLDVVCYVPGRKATWQQCFTHEDPADCVTEDAAKAAGGFCEDSGFILSRPTC